MSQSNFLEHRDNVTQYEMIKCNYRKARNEFDRKCNNNSDSNSFKCKKLEANYKKDEKKLDKIRNAIHESKNKLRVSLRKLERIRYAEMRENPKTNVGNEVLNDIYRYVDLTDNRESHIFDEIEDALEIKCDYEIAYEEFNRKCK